MTGWIYLIALLCTIASVAYGSGAFVAAALGFTPTVMTVIWCALGLLLVATIINFMGTKVLAIAAIIGFSAEIIGALVVGIWLIVANRHQSFGVIFDSFGAPATGGSYTVAFLAAALIGIYQYYGFEACGDVAEEVPNPGRLIPKAMRRTIYIGGAAATFVCFALILAVVDMGAVIRGEDTDPVTTILNESFGETGARIVLWIVLISFLSCAMSLQAAASRLAYSYGRDGMIVGSDLLKRFSSSRGIPPYALLLAAIVPALIVIGSMVSTNAVTKIVSFAALGIYLGFQMVVLAALRARLKGWVPSGQYTLGRWGLLVNIGALVYGVLAIINMIWSSRTPGTPWYDDWIVGLTGVIVVGSGLIYLSLHRGVISRGDAPYNDAIPRPAEAGQSLDTAGA